MKQAWLLLAVAGLLLAVGCSSAPAPPKPGTPVFQWGAAKQAYQTGNFLKASENLTLLTVSDSEFAARSVPWSMVLTAGIAQGYIELADNFDMGGRANRSNPAPFRRQAVVFRGYASTAAMQTAETLHRFLASPAAKNPMVQFEFAYPSGSVSQPVQLQRVSKGVLFPDAEIEVLEKAMVQRGVALAAARLVGAGADSAAAQEIFRKGDVQVKREVFMMAMARTLVDQADLFGPKQLDQPNRAKVLYNEAAELLQLVPESKETKELTSKIAKIRKASKLT